MNNLPALHCMLNFKFSLIKPLVVLFFLSIISISAYSQTQTINYDIRLNQIGYYPNLEKKVFIDGTEPLTNFYVQSVDHTTNYFTGTVGTSRIADFSSFATAGTYVLFVPAVGYSAPFKINADVLKDLSSASMKGYYYKRASTVITAAQGGVYARAAGHPDTQVMIHSSAASVGRPVGTIVSSPKGWYDAGDYNCYVVNSNITTYTLLSAYEHFQSYYDTLKLNIPESGNGIPDILNEIKWNLDWMLTMQDPYDGGVYDKKTTAAFSDFVMPAEDQAQRYMVGKSKGSTYGFAAVMAVAYRIYLPHDPVYANKCLEASKKAYTTTATLGTGNNPSGITTGEYASQSDEKAWAGIELYISTKNESYYVPKYWTMCDFVPKWYEVNSVGLMSLVLHRKNLTAIGLADTTAIKNKLLGFASNTRSNAGYVSLFNSEWGGNSFALNAGMMDMCAYQLTKDRGYLNSAIFILDYVLGKNGTSYSFVTGFGSKTPMHPHDRISASDGVVEPVPGWLVGGGSNYVDVQDSYSTNEVAINWNAPLVFLTGAVQYANRSDKKAVLRVLDGVTSISSNQTPALSFGSAIINTESTEKQTITIKNSGTIPLLIKSITASSGFVLSALNPASPITPGSSSVFTITATPQNAGINTGKVTIETNDLDTPVFVLNLTVKGKFLNQPFLQVLKGTDVIPSNNAPSVLVGSALTGTAASPMTITLVNEGSVPLTINSITGTSGFQINTAASPATINADGSSTFTITATPANAGINEGVITIKTNDPSNLTYIINVSSMGLVPSLSVEAGNKTYTSNGDPYYFGRFAIGEQSYVVELKIRNTGKVRLILDKPVITGPYHQIGQFPAYLDAGEVGIFSFVFEPTLIGIQTGTISFASNAGTPFILNLSGTGKAPPALQMKVSQGTTVFNATSKNFEFPATLKGTTSAPVIFTITNIGTEVLSISDVQLFGGAFQLTQAFSTTSIAVGSSITFAVVFKPDNSYNSGTAMISASGISSFSISLSGYETLPPVPKIKILQNLTEYYNNSTGYVYPATALSTASAEVVFTIRNEGNAALTISDLTATGPFELAQAFTGGSIASGDSKTFSLVFKPVTTSITTGYVSITNNVTDSPFLLNVNGTVNTALSPIMKITQGATIYTSNGSVLGFPETIQGSTSNAEVITITNTGNAALSISDLTLTGPFELSQAFTATSIAASASKTFSVVFKPVSITTAAGNAIITSNVTGSPFILKFSGTGILAMGTVSLLASDAILISPNPTKHDIEVKINGTFSNVSVNVYNALGEHVLTKELGSVEYSSFPLSLSDVASGMYMLEIITDQGMSMKRIVKE